MRAYLLCNVSVEKCAELRDHVTCGDLVLVYLSITYSFVRIPNCNETEVVLGYLCGRLNV